MSSMSPCYSTNSPIQTLTTLRRKLQHSRKNRSFYGIFQPLSDFFRWTQICFDQKLGWQTNRNLILCPWQIFQSRKCWYWHLEAGMTWICSRISWDYEGKPMITRFFTNPFLLPKDDQHVLFIVRLLFQISHKNIGWPSISSWVWAPQSDRVRHYINTWWCSLREKRRSQQS